MHKKFQDFQYHAFSYDTEMIVVCPICGKAGHVQYDPNKKIAYFKCDGCYTHKKIIPGADHSKKQYVNASETISQVIVLENIRHGEDPYFHYPLYYQTNFRGNIVWAMNKQHLQYLIDYISAKIRSVDADFHKTNKTMRSQSDRLPTFMKTAKNRESLRKALIKLQKK